MAAKRKRGKGRPSLSSPISPSRYLILTCVRQKQADREAARNLGRTILVCFQGKPSARTPSKFPPKSQLPLRLQATTREQEQAGRQGVVKEGCWSSCWWGAAAWWCSSTAPASSSARSSPRATPSPGPSGACRPRRERPSQSLHLFRARSPFLFFSSRDLSRRQGASCSVQLPRVRGLT
jgi:hypothetical protein